MPDVDTPDPEAPPSPEQIEAWPSGRIADETPVTTPNPAGATRDTDPEDAAVPSEDDLPEPGDGLAQPSGGAMAGS